MENRYVRQFKKGALEMILLCLIAQGETYGYELLTRLNQQGGSVLATPGRAPSIPSSTGLQEQGLLQIRLAPSPANGGMKKYYSLTEQGREALGELTDFWEKYVRCVDGFLDQAEEETV